VVVNVDRNNDMGPAAVQVNQHEAALKAAGITYQFNRYDGAGHGILYYHSPNYRQQAAMDGWEKVLDWFNQRLMYSPGRRPLAGCGKSGL
jgi:carboxymethylenebutenolidase